MREGIFGTLYLALGYPEGRPTGAEKALWDNLRALLGPRLAVRVAGGDVQPEEALLSLLAHSFFLRLPLWTEPARAAYRKLLERVEPREPDLWRRRFISDLAGLESLLRPREGRLVLLEPLFRNYEALLAEPPEEEPHPEHPVMMRGGIPAGPLGPWEEEVAWAVYEETGAEAEADLRGRLARAAQALLEPLSEAPPEVQRAALLDLVHFEGVPRVPPGKRGRLASLSLDNVGLLLSL